MTIDYPFVRKLTNEFIYILYYYGGIIIVLNETSKRYPSATRIPCIVLDKDQSFISVSSPRWTMSRDESEFSYSIIDYSPKIKLRCSSTTYLGNIGKQSLLE